RKDILVVTTHIEHQSIVATAGLQVAVNPLRKYAVRKIPIGCNAIGFANFQTQSQAKAIYVADDAGITGLQGAQAREEICSLVVDQSFVVSLLHHLQGLQ